MCGTRATGQRNLCQTSSWAWCSIAMLIPLGAVWGVRREVSTRVAVGAEGALEIELPSETKAVIQLAAQRDVSQAAGNSEVSQPAELAVLTGEAADVQELSVEPESEPLLPENAPAWVAAPPETGGELHRLSVGGAIAESASEAEHALDEALETALREYVQTHVLAGEQVGRGLEDKLTADYVWKNLIDEPQGYVARLNTAGVPLYQKWVALSITPEQRAIIRDWNQQALQRQRLGPVGLGLLGLLGSVGLLHLAFKGRKPQS